MVRIKTHIFSLFFTPAGCGLFVHKITHTQRKDGCNIPLAGESCEQKKNAFQSIKPQQNVKKSKLLIFLAFFFLSLFPMDLS